MDFFAKYLTKTTNFILNLKREFAIAFLISAVLISISPLLANISTETVLVANKNLAAGSTLDVNDFTEVTIPAKYKAPNAIYKDEIQNLSLTSNIQKGEQLTSSRILSVHNPNEHLVPIRISDSQISKIIQAGQTVDVVASGEREISAKVVARAVRIVALYPETQAFTNSQGILVLVAAEPDAAVELAGSSNLKLSVVIRNK